MHIYIDESIDEQHFVMGAVKSDTEQNVEECIKLTRGWLRQRHKSGKSKIIIPEFKDRTLTRQYPDIKDRILESLVYTKGSKKQWVVRRGIGIYGVIFNKQHYPNMKDIELYPKALETLLRICDLEYCNNSTHHVMLDQFGNKKFWGVLINTLQQKFPNVSFERGDSSAWPGLQVADLISGILRRSELDDDLESGSKISPLIRSVRRL